METLTKDLQKILVASDVKTDIEYRRLYSRDASFYEITPQAVVYPSSIEEIVDLVRYSSREKIPITFRGGGTSLSGQAIGEGIIVDTTRHINGIEVLKNGSRIRCGVGARGELVNKYLEPFGYKIGPDPASIGAATIGGIVANNASGMCCGISDNSYQTLDSLVAVLHSGYVFRGDEDNADQRLFEHEPAIANGLLEIRKKIINNESLRNRIEKKYQIKNTVGYGLNSFLDFASPSEILQHILVGSEGTLAFIAEVVYRTVPLFKNSTSAFTVFNSVAHALNLVDMLKGLGATAVELMDGRALLSVEKSALEVLLINAIQPNYAGLLIEFQRDDARELEEVCSKILIDESSIVCPFDFTSDKKKQQSFWKIRKGAFPAIGAARKPGTVLINEDVAFPHNSLEPAISDLQKLFVKYNYNDAILYGHAKDGNLHFAISQDLSSKDEVYRYESFMDSLGDLVVGKYSGSLKAEHGTGRNVAPFVEREWGSELYQIMREIKQLLDPSNIFNPGVLLNSDSKIHVKNLKSIPLVDPEIDSCIECGFCEPVCPSRNVTLTPRQRIVSERTNSKPTAHFLQYDVIDTCAADGMCATKCPVGIDTGNWIKRKRNQKNGALANKVASRICSNKSTTTNLASSALKFGSVFNTLPLVEISGLKNVHPCKKLTHSSCSNPDVYFFKTCVNSIMSSEPNSSLEEQFIDICQRVGKKVEFINSETSLCCGNAFDSKGFKNQAAACVNEVSTHFSGLQPDIPIVIDGSSCSAVLSSIATKTYSIVEFLDTHIIQDLCIAKKNKIVLHPTCADVKSNSLDLIVKIARICAEEVVVPINLSCCGFAGDKGITNPSLTCSATKYEAAEVMRMENVSGYYSTNTPCEIALSRATNKQYKNILSLVWEASTP